MWTEDYRWHFDYVRLAWDAGFSFEKNKCPNLDKNKICVVDVDRVVRERDVASIERCIPTVVQYILESDQAEVLDANFVKMFRLSQLSVEYLLFCKKYLDNTVVLLKKEAMKLKEEVKELRLFTQELENHISTLTKHNNLVTTFKCEKCSKVFSTEEYLDSHIKRRHTDEIKCPAISETDVLQSEIKVLKERLNATEKLLQEKGESKTESAIDESKLRVEEIQDKFDKFKEKVENDLKILQVQKNFYEDKYSKLFDIVISNKENAAPQKLEPAKEEMEHLNEDVVDKIESTTQTDTEKRPVKELQMEPVQNKNVYNFKNNSSLESPRESLTEKKESIEDTIEQKILKFEENIELKISSSLNNIGNQMEAFWKKLSELELNREKMLSAQENRQSVIDEGTNTLEVPKPPIETPKLLTMVPKPEIKPRTKLTKSNKINTDSKSNAEKIKNEIEKIYSKPGVKSVSSAKSVEEKKSQVKVTERASTMMYDSSSTSEPDSETKSESSIVEIMPKKVNESKPSLSTTDKQSLLSIKSSAKSKESLNKFREDINEMMNDRLQEMGISPNWQGIPQKTFEKAIAIVEHQASLVKKIYPEYDSIKKSIEKSLKNNKELIKRCSKRKSKPNISPNKQQPNVINISYRKVPKETESEPELKTQTVTIKNRSLYEDTESDSVQPHQPLSHSQPLPAYSHVIDEIKTAQKTNADTDSDLTSLILPNDDIPDDKNEFQTKSVLKNYPSMGSLTKKKVLFDIETDESNNVDEKRVVLEEQSVPNVASLLPEKKGEKEDGDKKDDLSDFDFSEY